MTSLKNKPGGRLQPESFEVVVIKDPNMRPFLNVFQIDGRNIQQQKLGKIFGIIQIDDNSENSAYLPNLLTQILKKEYYKNKNKGCGKSFEIALHKLNLALTELAQHEIVKWINNLNAVVGVICEKEIHFTQIGKGRLILLKNDKFVVIGDANSAKDTDYHPMKTFSTISAGKIREGDKLIFTIQETFRTLKKEELERHHKTFNSDEFDNIVSSTLRNEASNTGMVVVNVSSQEIGEPETILEPEVEETVDDDLNFFGKEEQKNKPKKKERKNKSKENVKEEPPKKEDPNKSPFENEPEIFLKEDSDEDLEEIIENNKKSKAEEFKELLITKTKSIIKKFKKKPPIIKKISFNKVNIGKLSKKVSKKIDKKKITELKERLLSFGKKIYSSSGEKIKKQWDKIDFKKIKKFSAELFKNNFQKIKKEAGKIIKKTPDFKKIFLTIIANLKFQKLSSKIGIEVKVKPNEDTSEESLFKESKEIKDEEEKENFTEKPEESLTPSLSQSEKEILDSDDDFFSRNREDTPKPKKEIKKINFAAWKNHAEKFLSKVKLSLERIWDNKKRKTVILIILGIVALIVLIFGIFKFINSRKIPSEVITSGEQNFVDSNQNSTNQAVNLKKLNKLNRKIKDSVFFRNELFLLTEKNSLIKFSIRDNNEIEIPLPKDLVDPQYLSTISSLQLVLLISQNQVYSYSPVTNSFSENRINIPPNSEIAGTGTYLTYLYLLDKNSNQIYRYYRAPGGFGEYKAWLKEDVNIENATSLDISDSIYISYKDNLIEKYFENKKISDFRLEDGFAIDKIRTKVDSDEIFAFDKEKGKIIELSEKGEFKKYFQDKVFKDAISFSVDFENKKVFLVTEDLEIVVFNY